METPTTRNEGILQRLVNRYQEINPYNQNSGDHLEIQEALDHERELYLDLANALPIGIYRLRVFHDEGIREDKWFSLDNAPYKIEFVNDRFCEILSIDKDAFIKNPAIINNFIFEDDKAEFVRKNVEANMHTNPFLWEGRFFSNNELLWIHFESIPRVLENKDILWTGTLTDITAHRRADEELQQKNNELQLLNAEKDKFFSIIAHDLRSPFNSIIGFCGLLAENIGQQDQESLQEYTMIIRDSAERAMNLLTNLMQWSQSQTGRMIFNPEYFDLSSLINEIFQLYESFASQKSIHITKELPVEIPVYADKAMIGTIIRNLISNAIKFTNQGGIVHVIAKINPKEVEVSVSDTGVGIEKSVMEKIFHIDFGYSSPDTLGNKGTGLGLMLCKEFVDKHKGTIGIESEPGKGSVFHFTIPTHTQDPSKYYC